MPLNDIDDQMEELEEGEDRESGESESLPARQLADSNTAGTPAKLKKTAKYLGIFALAAILAYFLLQQPLGGKGAATPASSRTHEFGMQTVNLRGGSSAVRLNVVVEVNDPQCLSDVAGRDSLLRDKVIDTVSQKTTEEIDGVVKRNKLKRELLDQFNLELNLDNGRLTKVYFREFFYFEINNSD